MIITINPDWRLASDPLQWMLQKSYQSKGEERWRSIAFFGDIDRAIVELSRRRILVFPGSYPAADALGPLSDALRSVRDDTRAALATFQTEAAAYHGRAGS